MAAKMQRSGDAAILYDGALLDHADAALFMPPPAAASAVGGRGSAWILDRGGEQWVLRHYRRGGFAAKVSSDLYLWTGLEGTRAWREWRLLDSLYKEDLPVPQPVAARVTRHGLFYRADLVTRRIGGTRSLTERLQGDARRIPWGAIGACIRRFHDAGVCHADLNAHNLLLDEEGKVYLIDFDRGTRRRSGDWKQANLARLRRSLDKLLGRASDAGDWAALLEGYRAA
ncbi:MAG TPA: 3-deoxy-D-manno-octulosonic acid kinase [Gammaproteobacteria bacterium]|jgi:3-deoxy-D-manno-octulosonic acid kinase|nr:3-deoxy-D-manno-octulosonic acid kinase [Gammaproteobacteria bacterium]